MYEFTMSKNGMVQFLEFNIQKQYMGYEEYHSEGLRISLNHLGFF